MLSLSNDIVLDDSAFKTASDDMKALKIQTEELKEKMKQMYKDLKSAMNTPSGAAVDLTAENVLIKPIDDMLLVIDHVSSMLTEIIGTSYYKDVFIKFNELNSSINL